MDKRVHPRIVLPEPEAKPLFSVNYRESIRVKVCPNVSKGLPKSEENSDGSTNRRTTTLSGRDDMP